MNLFLFFCEIINDIGRNIPIMRILIVAFPLNCTFSGDPIQYLQCSVSFRSADCCSPWEMDYVEEEGVRKVSWPMPFAPFGSIEYSTMPLDSWSNEISSKQQNTDWLTYG